MSTLEQTSVIATELNPDFNPLKHPALALQTYESFGSDPGRKDAKANFADGTSTHLVMEYPVLEGADLSGVRDDLVSRAAIAHSLHEDSPEVSSSIANRLAEVDFLGAAWLMNFGATEAERVRGAKEFVRLNDGLYGKPDEEFTKSLLGTVVDGFDSSNSEVATILEKLQLGFETKLQNGKVVRVPGINLPNKYEPIPEVSEDARKFLEVAWKRFASPLLEAQGNIADHIAVRDPNFDSETYNISSVEFGGADLYKVFKLGAAAMSEVENLPEISVILNPDGSEASWETNRMSVVVGSNRPIGNRSWAKIRGVTAHELTHAEKAANGIKHGNPALATGVFTLDASGNWVSYLDFEEGNNKLGERVIAGEEAGKMTVEKIKYQLVADLVYKGFDDRQCAEVLRELYTAEALTRKPDELVNQAKINSSIGTAIERMFRGTNPSSGIRVDGHLPIFTKDLAYRVGELKKAIPFWNKVATAAQARKARWSFFMYIFDLQNQGKIDPTVEEQWKIVTSL